MKFDWKVMALSYIVVMLVGACGGPFSNNSGPLLQIKGDYPSRVGEVTPSGVTLGGIYRRNESADPRSLDPVRTGESSAHAVAKQIYNALVEFDHNMKIQPGLASSWEVSDDGKVYTFQLREGVRFHDDPCFPDGKGREMTAEDVKYSFTRVVNQETLSTGDWIFKDDVVGVGAYVNGEADEVSGFKVLDDYTFQIQLKEPFAPFINRLAMSYAFVVPHEAVEHYDKDYFRNPVGTGAFDFVHWKPNQEILMVRNPHYWKKDQDGVRLPYLDGQIVSLLADFKVEFLEFDVGNLDEIKEIHQDLWTKVMDENGHLRPNYQKYILQNELLYVTQYYGFNLSKEPFKDNKALRQAINYAIDRESIIQYVLNGRGVPAKGLVPPGIPGYESDVEGYSYDPEKAQALLAEAGYPNGEGLGQIELELNSGGTMNELIAEAIQQQLNGFGLKVRLQLVEWSQHLQNIDDNKASFFRLGWIADYPDPENFLTLMWSKNFPPNGPNYSRFEHEEFDRLYIASLREQDRDKRFELYRQAENIVVEEAPWLFLYNTNRYRLVQPYVRNNYLNPQELPMLDEVWLEIPQVESGEGKHVSAS